MQDLDFNEVVELICKEDSRFDRKAYTFIRQGLDHTVKEYKKKDPAKPHRSQPLASRRNPALRSVPIDRLPQWGQRK